MARIATGRGDKGETSLASGQRVPKDHLRVEAYGAVDELNAVLGIVLTLGPDERTAGIVTRLQHELFVLGSDLATAPGTDLPRIEASHVEQLDRELDELEAALPPLKQFIHPGGTPAAAWLHQARTVARRAERRTVSLARQEEVSEQARVYLNRLSDLLFLLARRENHVAGRSDVLVTLRPPRPGPGGTGKPAGNAAKPERRS